MSFNTLFEDGQLSDDEEILAFYADKFNLPRERNYARPRAPKNAAQRSREHREAVDALADEAGLASHWQTTYTPALFESGWLQDSLRPFYEVDLITDVMAQIKGGKEASVYRCRAHESFDSPWLAAKIYRPRKLRNLRNDAMYREGRPILSEQDGKPVSPRDDRIVRAIGKKTAFGVQVQHTSWLMYEYTTLQMLYEAGVAVPRPIAVGENAILMEYIGDEGQAAPTLHEVTLPPEEVHPLFEETMRNIDVMMQHDLIHGDLSAYNILYWRGKIVLIDFPQVIQAESNRNAQRILRRDVQRVCDYFQGYGIRSHPARIADEFWQRYAAPHPMDLMADLSTLQPDGEDA